MLWHGLIGHERVIARLREQVRTHRLPHALLFEGPEQVGKTTVARVLVAALLCDAGEGNACGACRSCRAVMRGQHPDVIEVVPRRQDDGSVGGTVIHIWQIARREKAPSPLRPLREEVMLRPYWGPRKCFLIEPAHRLQHDAANALLKTLEEPAGSALFVLVTARPGTLPETVRSRCQRVVFSAVPPSVIMSGLARRGIAPAVAERLAVEAGGRPGVAVRLASDPTLAATRNAVLEVAAQLHTAHLTAALKLAEELRTATLRMAACAASPAPREANDAAERSAKRRSEESDAATLRRGFPLVAVILAEWFRDAARAAHAVNGPLRAHPAADALREQAHAAGTAGLLRAVRAVERSVWFMESNANADLVFDALTVQLLTALRGRERPAATRSTVGASEEQ